MTKTPRADAATKQVDKGTSSESSDPSCSCRRRRAWAVGRWMVSRFSLIVGLWALAASACSGVDQDTGSDASESLDSDAEQATVPSADWTLPTLLSTATDSLRVRAVALPDGLGPAIAELDSDTLLLPAVGAFHLCRTRTEFCDDRRTVQLDLEGDWTLGRPTAVHAESGTAWVAYENGLVSVRLDTGATRLLARFDSARNTTAVTPIRDVEADALDPLTSDLRGF